MVGQCQTHIGQKTAGQHIDFFLRAQLDGMAQRLFGLAGIVACNDFDAPTQQAASHIDFFNRQLPALAVRLGELGHGGVAVDFTDLHRVAGTRRL